MSRWLEEAIKYLERVRFSRSYEESVTSAAAGGFVREEFFSNNHEDFILDTATIDPPPESSWLKVGGVFSGSQHAANGSHSVLYRLSDRSNTIGAPSPPANPDQHQIRTSRQHWLPSTDVTTANGTTTNTTTTNNNRTPHGDERWPVKVTIHSIDYSSMTLSGTMEAFNVPDKSSPTQESSITTFLEGEIIDFNTYTLETKSFKADARIDGTYWRKLEPFKRLTDDEIVRNLVSRRWLTEVLSRNWILMRWKGMYQIPNISTFRSGFSLSTLFALFCHGFCGNVLMTDGRTVLEKCFITPSEHRSGLTISGFYYVSLRRDNGQIEGLYYDPSSSPYQHLTLTPEKRGFPVYEFR